METRKKMKKGENVTFGEVVIAAWTETETGMGVGVLDESNCVC